MPLYEAGIVAILHSIAANTSFATESELFLAAACCSRFLTVGAVHVSRCGLRIHLNPSNRTMGYGD